MERLGFFGGCFNPPTIAHIELIEKAIIEYNLDKVYFVPMGDLYEKQNLIPSNYRVDMLKKSMKERMEILDISIKSKINLKAIDTFKIIEKQFNDSDNYFIMGSDNYEKIKYWKNANELLANYKYIILKRTDDISSSLVRKKIKNNEDVSKFIYKDVEEYILEKGLYK